jgi:hypothetical protein
VLINSDFFDFHPELYDRPSYHVESQVDPEDCEAFLGFLQTQETSSVTAENSRALLALADEFGVPVLAEMCCDVESAATTRNLIGRVLSLEDSSSQQQRFCEVLQRGIGRIFSDLSRVSEELRGLKKETDNGFSTISAKCQKSIDNVKYDLSSSVVQLKSATETDLAAVADSIRGLAQLVENRHLKTLKKVSCPLTQGP